MPVFTKCKQSNPQAQQIKKKKTTIYYYHILESTS